MFYQTFMAIGLGGEFTRRCRLSIGKLNFLYFLLNPNHAASHGIYEAVKF